MGEITVKSIEVANSPRLGENTNCKTSHLVLSREKEFQPCWGGGAGSERAGGAVSQGPPVPMAQTRAVAQLPADKQGWRPSPALPLVHFLLLPMENSLKIELEHEKKKILQVLESKTN